MDRQRALPVEAGRVAQAKRIIARQRQRIVMLEAAGCSTRNAQRTVEVLLRTLAHERALGTQASKTEPVRRAG
jgi:hypothetical protein